MRKQENYLDYIPKRNSRYSYQLNEHGNVEIIVKMKDSGIESCKSH